MYSAVNLDKESRMRLLNMFSNLPSEWELICHHMTIALGNPSPEIEARLGEEVHLIADTFAQDDKVIAIGVKTDIPSKNKIKHITIAVNRLAGGKPVLSNSLTDWHPMTPIYLSGQIAVNN